MDITTIDAISFATRVGNVAASELYGLLTEIGDAPLPNWFDPRSTGPAASPNGSVSTAEVDAWLEQLGNQVGELGQYVCANQVDQGERLYRWAGSRGIAPLADWSTLDIAGRQAFEAFTDTVRHTYLGLATAQKALEDARAAAGVRPAGLKREDSIFEDEEPLGKLRDEAVAAAPQIARYSREREAAEKAAAAEKARQDDADAAAAEKAAAEEKRKAARAKPPQPVSAGESLAGAATPNKGGRGKKKPQP